MKKIPIISITIGYIIGCIWGLYCKISIAFMYIPILIYAIINKKQNKRKKFKLLSIKRYSKYLKLILDFNSILLISISSIISNIYISKLNYEYNTKYIKYNNENISIIATIISNKKKQEYNNQYIIKCQNGDKMYLTTDNKIDLHYGQKIKVNGKYKEPEIQRNEYGFNYKEYLKSIQIFGTIQLEDIESIKECAINKISIKINQIYLNCIEKIENHFSKEVSGILEGILIGNTDKIENKIRENFSSSNMAHILAISGMHMSYIYMVISISLKNITGKKSSNIITIIILVVYTIMIKGSSSAIRAMITTVLALGAKLTHRKNNNWNSLAISILCILIINPFAIRQLSLQLSYIGVIAILIFNPSILYLLNNVKIINKNSNFKFVSSKINESISIMISVQLGILPIIIYNFNKINLSFIFTSFISGILIIPIMILGILFLLFSIVNLKCLDIIYKILAVNLNFFVKILIYISDKFGNNQIGKIYITRPNIISIIIYYIIILLFGIYISNIKVKRKSMTQIRIKNIIRLIQYKMKYEKIIRLKNVLLLVIVMSVVFTIFNSKKQLEIDFIDVGQGDSTLIITPTNKKILIDGGGSEKEEDNVGKNILLPFLLKKKVLSIDYIIISHFDSDHCGGLLYIINEIKVKNIIIGKQYETSNNYEKFCKILKGKNIKVYVVEANQILKPDKNIILDIIWPYNQDMISENAINNNSLVFKFKYKDFSMLFTGDIEELAEKNILNKYKKEKLNATVLKVAHHGSKTSSIKEFIQVVSPKYAVIGVGKNNKFGHPAPKTLETLKSSIIYRTDLMGEIILKTDGKKMIRFKNIVK